MKKLLPILTTLIYAQGVQASLIQYFKDERGETNWQYVANFSSSLLILLLSVALITLFFSHRRAVQANKALEEIRNALEQRVEERTATLNESNRLLQVSEAYIKDILESMPLMLIGLDKNMNVTQWNKRAETITGKTSDKVLGKNLWAAYPTITVSPNQINEVLDKNKPTTIKHSQRGQYYFDITIYPLRDRSDTGLVIMVDDVTQRILTENMLIQRDKMSSMGELAATMSYDISIPLQAILKVLQSVRRELARLEAENANGNDQVEFTKEISKLSGWLADASDKGSQASAIINNLLEFSRTHGDKKQDASLPEIVDHAIDLARDVISDAAGLRFRDITIDRHYEENLPTIPGYISELQQVFLSLFRHACHALARAEGRQEFEPTIRVDIIQCYDAIWIKVQHNGLGLTGEEQQYLFEPFFNNNNAENKNVNNDAAKRLSFSYFIITEHHQGQMAVTSDVNVGTTFHIELRLIGEQVS